MGAAERMKVIWAQEYCLSDKRYDMKLYFLMT